MTYKAYFDAIEAQTGLKPDGFHAAAKQKGILKPGLTATQFLAWLAADFKLGRGHGMALWKWFGDHNWLPAKK